MAESFVVPVDACGRCGYIMDRATGDALPKAGDFTICLACGDLLRFGNDLRTRGTTCIDVADLDDEQRDYIRRAQAFIQAWGPLRSTPERVPRV